MTKVTGPAMSLSATKTLGKKITYQKTPSGHKVSKHSFPGSRAPFKVSTAQLAQRAKHAELIKRWQALTQAMKDEWDVVAGAVGYAGGAGFHFFIHREGVKYEVPPLPEAWYLNGDQNDDYVKRDNIGLSCADEITLEMWCRMTKHETSRPGGFFPLGTRFIYDAGGENIYMNINGDQGGANQSRTWNAPILKAPWDKFHHIALVKDAHDPDKIVTAGMGDLFFNGVKTGVTNAGSYSRNNNPDDLFLLNKDTFDTDANMDICEVRLWDKRLNPADILLHAKDPRNLSVANTGGATIANLYLHWKVLETDTASLSDASGNNRPGTYRGVGEPALLKAIIADEFALV